MSFKQYIKCTSVFSDHFFVPFPPLHALLYVIKLLGSTAKRKFADVCTTAVSNRRCVCTPEILPHKVYGHGYKGARRHKRVPLSDTSGSKERRHRKATYAVPLCRPMDTSRYICSSTRCPVSGTNLYVHLEGPWRYGDFICPKPRFDLPNSCLLSNVMLHTEIEQNDRIKIRENDW